MLLILISYLTHDAHLYTPLTLYRASFDGSAVLNISQLDPMFHTISKLFDKGGMEGMLMYNLRVNPYTSSMALNQDGLENPFPVQQGDHAPIAPSPSSSSSGSGLLDLTALINASQLTMADLSELTICPQLGIYRTQIHGQGQVPSAAGEGTINTGSLNPVDFVGSHFRNVETTDAPLLGPSVHSLTRDLTVIPFADMSAEMKTHTFANPAHAYFDGMAAMIAPVAPVPDMGLFNKEVAYDYADNDDVGDIAEAVHGNDIDDCDEDGNYVASERRATMAPAGGAMSSEEAGMSNKHNARQSMLQVTDVNGKDDSVMPASKIQWGAVNGNVELTQADLLTVPETALHNSLNEVIASGAVAQETGEYAFFDISALMAQGAGNDWAGAKHWKRGAARATRASTRVAESSKVNTESSDNVTEVGADADESATGKKGSKASRSKKTGLEIDFIALAEGDHSARCYPAEILFKAPVSRSTTSNTTLMTAAAISKQNDSADAGEYFLPVDSKLLPKDLCRLFLVPRMVVPPAALSHMIKSSGASTKGKDTSSLSNAASQDLIWGQRNVDETSRFGEELPSDETADMQYGAADDLDYDNDDLYAQIQAAQALEHSSAADALAIDDALPDTHPNAAVLQDNLNNSNMHVSAASSSLTIDESKLVKAGRKVGKIDIGYSSVAKRINVKQLKVDIWQEIAQLAGVERENIHKNIAHESEENENAPPAADFHATVCQAPSEIADKSSYCDGKQMSFQGLVNDLALRQKQKDVSVSFYFICLLHLANEKTLKITDNDCLDDLIVSKD